MSSFRTVGSFEEATWLLKAKQALQSLEAKSFRLEVGPQALTLGKKVSRHFCIMLLQWPSSNAIAAINVTTVGATGQFAREPLFSMQRMQMARRMYIIATVGILRTSSLVLTIG